MQAEWRVYRCAQGHFVALRRPGPCPKCGGPVEPVEDRREVGEASCGEPSWLELKAGFKVYEVRGLRFKVYGAKAEVRETDVGVAVDLAE